MSDRELADAHPRRRSTDRTPAEQRRRRQQEQHWLRVSMPRAGLAAVRALALYSTGLPSAAKRIETLAKWFGCVRPDVAADLVLEELRGRAGSQAASRRPVDSEAVDR